jgi:hypothetical protein
MKTCPRCSLLNPDDGTVCECGFDLVSGDAVAAAGARRSVRRRGRSYQIGGLAVIILGLAGGTSFFPFHVSIFFTIESYRADVGMIFVGALLLARGARLIDRPWTETASDKPTG